MSPAPSLTGMIEAVRRAARRDAVQTVALLAFSVVPVALLVAWLVGWVRPWSAWGAGPLLFDAAVLLLAGGLAWLAARRWLGRLGVADVAAAAERDAGVPDGAVRGQLELEREVPAGTSPALARLSGVALGRRLAESGGGVASSLTAAVRLRRRRVLATSGVLCLAVAALGFAAPDHSRAAWSPLASPVSALRPPALPALEVLPGTSEVARGADVPVRVRAVGRTVVTVHWRSAGDVPRSEVVAVRGDSAVVVIPEVGAITEYSVEAPDGAHSPVYRLTPADALLLAELTVDVVYPAHVGRATEHYTGEVPALEVPAGTQLVIAGSATRTLGTVAIQSADRVVALRAEGARFTGSFAPRTSGLYAWHLTDGRGAAPAVAPAPLDITVTEDAAPTVGISFPAVDTVLDASLRQAIVADARDDHGLAGATLVSWRSGRGGREAPVETPVPLDGGERVLIRTVLDATRRNLIPGDTLRFFIRVTDSSPARQTGVSTTVALRLPTRDEQRDRVDAEAEALARAAESLTQDAAELAEATRALEQRTGAANARRQADAARRGGSGSTSQRMEYSEAAPARQVLERQEALSDELAEMRDRLETLREAMARSGLEDAELRRRLDELRKLQEEVDGPASQQALEDLRKALEELDPEAVREALEKLAERQEELKEQLERSAEAMRRAAAEQAMNRAAQDARELAAQQEALAESMKDAPPSPEQAKTQEALAKAAGELERQVGELQERLAEQGEQAAAEAAGEAKGEAGKAQEQMQSAARDAAGKRGEQAARKGEQAAESLERAAETIDRAREAMAEEWKQQARESIDQATSDALSLAEQQQQLLDRMKQAEAGAQKGDGQQQGAQQQGGQQQGQQQGGQQQGGQQQGQQQGGQQQGQQQGGQQGAGQQAGGQQAGGQQGGGQQQGGQGQSGGTGDAGSIRSEQSALQGGLQQLGRNLQENAERDGMSRETSAALARANLAMQQTLEAMKDGAAASAQAQQTLDALNRLALSLLNSAQSMEASQSGTAGEQARQELSEIAQQQGSLNGQSAALSPMDLSRGALDRQLQRIAAEQMEVARRLGTMNQGGREDLMGDVDALAREAEALAQQLERGALPPDLLARQERLFHRMLDAGRSLEKDEYDDERQAERAGAVDRRAADALDGALFRDPTRFRAPSPEQLQALPPAYRRLILDYFERLNRPLPPTGGR